MRINRSLLGWGLFFIVLGAVPLAVRAGLVQAETVGRAWTLWPLVLIFGGLGLVLRRTPIEPVAGFAAAATFGLILGGLIATGGVPVGTCTEDGDARPFESRTGELGASARVEIELSCGELTLAAAGGSTWRVEGSGDEGRAPTIESSAGTLEVRTDSGANLIRSGNRWSVTLPAATQLGLDVQLNAGKGSLDFGGASIDRLEVQTNATETTIDLAGVTRIGQLEVQANAASVRIALPSVAMSGSVQVNAASVRLCRPADVGLRLTFEGVLSSNDFGQSGLTETNGGWQTAGYDTAAAKIDLRTQANLGSIELESEGACGA